MNSFSLTEKSPQRKKPVPSGVPVRKRAYRSYSPSDRAVFFLALERLGSVPLAARELGFNLSTCRAWAGPSGRKSGQIYAQAEKDKFFVLLDRLGSVSLAAKAMGINVQTCFHCQNESRLLSCEASGSNKQRVCLDDVSVRSPSRLAYDHVL
jgi:hypothetical protein